MIKLAFDTPTPLRVLCLGAHCDDIEIGCGGTLLRLIDAQRIASIDWIVFSSDSTRAAEARRSAEALLAGVETRFIEIRDFRDGFFPFHGVQVKGAFQAIQQRRDYDVVFTHHKDDLHQDHRLLAELTWQTFRNHLVLEYEIPKYDGNPFNPNVYVPIEESVMRRKINGLLTCFATQRAKPWFTPDTFLATLRLRGIECASPTRFAEAFVARKIMI